MAVPLNPADPKYWDDFYIDGDGHGDIYEWYSSYEVRFQHPQRDKRGFLANAVFVYSNQIDFLI